jgi:hypothetical protein
VPPTHIDSETDGVRFNVLRDRVGDGVRLLVILLDHGIAAEAAKIVAAKSEEGEWDIGRIRIEVLQA